MAGVLPGAGATALAALGAWIGTAHATPGSRKEETRPTATAAQPWRPGVVSAGAEARGRAFGTWRGTWEPLAHQRRRAGAEQQRLAAGDRVMGGGERERRPAHCVDRYGSKEWLFTELPP